MSSDKNPPAPGAQAAAGMPAQLIWQGSPSWRAFFWSFVLIFLVEALVVTAGVWGLVSMPDHRKLIGIAMGVLTVATGGYFLYLRLLLSSEAYKVTTARLEWERGIVSKKIDGMELWRVKDLRYHQGVWDRILGVGRIHVFSKDTTDPELCMFGLPPGRELYDRLTEAVTAARQARGVLGVVE